MAFSGKLVAANHADLLAKIIDFITGDPNTPGRDWTRLREESLEWGPAGVFRNTGLSGAEEVNIGLYAATYTDGVKGGLVCKVYKAFDCSEGGTDFLDTTYGNGTGEGGTHALLPCWNTAMNVWIWSNKARVMLVVESNGLYGNAYLGQFRRFSLPGENPWPLACLTDGYTNLWSYTTWHDTATAEPEYYKYDADIHRRSLPFVRRGCFPQNKTNYPWKHGCHQICRPDGVWTTHFVVCPTGSLIKRSEGYEVSLLQDTQGYDVVFDEGAPRLLLPLYLLVLDAVTSLAGSSVAGELYGVRWAPDKLAGTESTVDGYTLFPDVNRVEWHSFMAMGDE